MPADVGNKGFRVGTVGEDLNVALCICDARKGMLTVQHVATACGDIPRGALHEGFDGTIRRDREVLVRAVHVHDTRRTGRTGLSDEVRGRHPFDRRSINNLANGESMHECRHLLAGDVAAWAVAIVGGRIAAGGDAVVSHPLDVGDEHGVVCDIGEVRPGDRCYRDQDDGHRGGYQDQPSRSTFHGCAPFTTDGGV